MVSSLPNIIENLKTKIQIFQIRHNKMLKLQEPLVICHPNTIKLKKITKNLREKLQTSQKMALKSKKKKFEKEKIIGLVTLSFQAKKISYLGLTLYIRVKIFYF